MIVPKVSRRFTHLHRPHLDYSESVRIDFEFIEPYLPEKVGSILDIGCGMAGIDVLLKKKFPEAKLSLLDGDGLSPQYSWSLEGRPYSNLKATETLLKENGVKVDQWLKVGTKDLLQADLIISLLSWGFHYPLSSYKVKGFCIADLRKDFEEKRGLVIMESNKLNRCAWYEG